MDLLQRFEEYILAEDLCDPTLHRVLLAVSGGKDSILMTDLFIEAGYRVALAHCNFQLRGDDADLDEGLVLDYARELDVPVYVRHFDTEGYAQLKGISIQMAARDLRYEWFDYLASQLSFERIAIAHHASDQVETMLINQIRGTGIRGFQGMPARRGRIIRPLLFLTSDEVSKAVETRSLAYRDDLSNFESEYLRNRIRLDIVPVLKEIHPNLEETFSQNAASVRQSREFMDEQIGRLRKKWIRSNGDSEVFALEELQTYDSQGLILYEILHPYGFSAAVCRDILRSIHQGTSGLQFYSNTHQLLLDRGNAWIRFLDESHRNDREEGAWIDQQTPTLQWGSKRISVSWQAASDFDANQLHREGAVLHQAFFDADKVQFPLHIRSWRHGDKFKPFGMEGKQKKISDLFTELKIDLWQKESIPVIEDASGVIVWIAPYRQSFEYNIWDKTKNVLTLSYFCEDGN